MKRQKFVGRQVRLTRYFLSKLMEDEHRQFSQVLTVAEKMHDEDIFSVKNNQGATLVVRKADFVFA
jgi:hypothetical protein